MLFIYKNMSGNKQCVECQTTESVKFRSLGDDKWNAAESKGLVKVTWTKGDILCNKSYMQFIENPLRKGHKGIKAVVDEESVEEVSVVEEGCTKIELAKAIKSIAKIFYEREHVKNEDPIYVFDEMRELFQETDPTLKDFFDQLYSAARPLERNKQTMDRMKKLMVLICYLLGSLNNTKINAFKLDLAYYLDSVGTTNEGLNTMASIGVSTTARTVERKKKRMSDVHGNYVENALIRYSENAFVLNIDDYHNIHVPRQTETTETSRPTHMASILLNPCFAPAILRNRIINSKIVDDELIIKHLDERFIVNLGISYHNRGRIWDVGKEFTDDELLDRLTLHSYNDRLAERTSERHIKNAILVDFLQAI